MQKRPRNGLAKYMDQREIQTVIVIRINALSMYIMIVILDFKCGSNIF